MGQRWHRKWAWDADTDGWSPIPTRVVSNEESLPLPRARILGLNAAGLFGVDPAAHRNPVPGDYVSRLRAAYREMGPAPSLTQYGWVLEG
jgi:hypothetical protein